MKNFYMGAIAVVMAAMSPAAEAQLVTNGNFSQTYSTGSANPNTPAQLGLNGYGVSGWTNDVAGAYNLIYNPTLAGAAAYTSLGQYGAVPLYTSANGGSATAPASLLSPTGGNFLAADPAFQAGSISQLISGLTVGAQYKLSFWFAGSQQAGFEGATTAGWTGALGASTFATPLDSTPSKGFSPWQQFTTTITATSTSETLRFLAVGGPSGGQPPFALLDGISLTGAVPEPGTWALMLTGFGVIGLGMRRRKAATHATA